MDIPRLRLTAQGIATAPFDSVGAVVRHLFAMQAQDFPGVKWSVGLRAPTVTDPAVERAIVDREIVRSWPMRGTLHLMAAEDLHWMLALTGARTFRAAAGRHRQLGLEQEDFDAARRVAERELAAGPRLRSELLAAFDAAGVGTAGQRGAHLLLALSVTGTLVFGPVQGKQHSFALLDEWVPRRRELVGDEALAELATRYAISHGPVTDRDLAWWSSLTLTDARRGLAAAEDRLAVIETDGLRYFHAPGLEPATASTDLLPGFDEFVLGYQDRSAQLAPEHFAAIVPGGNGMFLPTIVVDGRIVGTWRRTVTTKVVRVTPHPFTDLVDVREAAGRYGAFLGLGATVEE